MEHIHLNKRELTCTRSGCDGIMKKGIAFDNQWRGMSDFPGDEYACTISKTGEAILVNVLKCTKCGYSIGPGIPERVRVD